MNLGEMRYFYCPAWMFLDRFTTLFMPFSHFSMDKTPFYHVNKLDRNSKTPFYHVKKLDYNSKTRYAPEKKIDYDSKTRLAPEKKIDYDSKMRLAPEKNLPNMGLNHLYINQIYKNFKRKRNFSD
jgi:hypothetical protein